MYKSLFRLLLILLMVQEARGGFVAYYSCLAAVGAAGTFGTAAILPALGFTSSGIAGGSWAATWMASYAGSVPAGSLFATLQSAGATGASWGMFSSITGSVSAICAALTAPLP